MDLGAFGNCALLTGAGLSKNWGGYLAGELWGCLLSHPKIASAADLRTIMLRRTNFEAALQDIRIEGRDESPFLSALGDVFGSHHRLMTEGALRRPSRFKFLKFTKRFKARGTGYFFTLNQDLLIESLIHDDLYHERPQRPGIPYAQGAYTSRFRSPLLLDHEALPPSIPIAVPTGGFPLAGQMNYVKLHGSVDWPGKGGMVVGGGKSASIAAHPLLNWYQEVFRSVCSQPAVRLMVIGYSFGDEHINDILAECVNRHGLRLYVVNTETPDALKNRLRPDIWNGLMGYSSRPLTDLFAGDDMQDTDDAARIAADFFT